jgi:hypothetical protein
MMLEVMRKQVGAGVSGAEHLRTWLLSQQWFTSILLPRLPRWLRLTLRKMYLVPLDVADHLIGCQRRMAPPRTSNFTDALVGYKSCF